jgi:hypothetical protein
VRWAQEIHILASFKSFALPTALEPFFSTAPSDLTERWTAPIFAGFVAAQAHHGAKNRVAFFVIFEIFEE